MGYVIFQEIKKNASLSEYIILIFFLLFKSNALSFENVKLNFKINVNQQL